MATKTKVEFAVRMTCQSCVQSVEDSLKGVDGIESVLVDLPNEQVVVETSLPSMKIKELLETTGRQVVLRGQGPLGTTSSSHLGAAVAILMGRQGVTGLARFVQLSKDSCLLEGTIDGLTPGRHGLHVHEYGDISQGCDSCGDHFNPYQQPHGNLSSAQRHVGDLGNVTADEKGRAIFRLEDHQLKVWDVIGRSLVIDGEEDNFDPLWSSPASQRIACGIIARSAGLFQNSKKVCACDGNTIWEDQPLPRSNEPPPFSSAL